MQESLGGLDFRQRVTFPCLFAGRIVDEIGPADDVVDDQIVMHLVDLLSWRELLALQRFDALQRRLAGQVDGAGGEVGILRCQRQFKGPFLFHHAESCPCFDLW